MAQYDIVKKVRIKCYRNIFHHNLFTYVKLSVSYGPGQAKMCHVICEQQRRRSACASAQSDQHLCFCCLDSMTCILVISKV